MIRLDNTLRRLSGVTLFLFVFYATGFAAVPGWINFQGQLAAPDGTPLDTTVSITFRLYADVWSDTPLWDEIHDVTTVGGLYSVQLGSADNFPQTFYDDATTWLGIQVGADTEMSPRTLFSAVPYAYRIGTIDEAEGGTIQGNVIIQGQGNIGFGNTNVGDQSFVAGSSNAANGDNSTIAGGTLNVNSGEASFIGGGYHNEAQGWTTTIAGGNSNFASSEGTSIAGGSNNVAVGPHATIGGGLNNRSRGICSVVAGGGGPDLADSNSASFDYSTVGGGSNNFANGAHTQIGGGYGNRASGMMASVGAGSSNTAGGAYSRVNGGVGNSASGMQALVGGGYGNSATAENTVIGGGRQNRATGDNSTVSGGSFNYARGLFSVIAGGGGVDSADTNSAIGNLTTIGGGYHNYAIGDASTIAGGYYHTASGNSATIGGGYRNTSTSFYTTVGGGTYNDATGQYATVAGGRNNSARGSHATVGGGGGVAADSNSALGSYSTIAGGSGNTVYGASSTIAGGRNNLVEDDYSFIGGGGGANVDSGNHLDAHASVICGGVMNWMDNDSIPTWYGVIGGGHDNWVGDTSATVPGGESNSAMASYSFAAGRHAHAWSRGSFVWSDAAGSASSDAANQFIVGASGGVKLFTNATRNLGTRLAASGTSWIVISDSAAKMNRVPVDGKGVLSKLATMPIDQWNYKHQTGGAIHYGPMAQDFWNAFHLGSDSLGIETLDADGVLFVAVKELAKQVTELRNEVATLRAQNELLTKHALR